jgi:anti-sigma B factor antagonist
MSSRGLRVLTSASQQARAVDLQIKLAAPNPVMREILEISRYDRLFDIDDHVPLAGGAA